MGLTVVRPKTQKGPSQERLKTKSNTSFLGIVYANNQDSYKLLSELLGLSQNPNGRAREFKIMGGVTAAIQLENKHANDKKAASVRDDFFDRASKGLDKFNKRHKIIDAPHQCPSSRPTPL